MKPKNILAISLIFSFLLLMSVTAYSQDKVGTSAAPFLGISIGAPATAMGGGLRLHGE